MTEGDMTEPRFYRKAKEWAEAGYPVRGHACEGLTRFQSLISDYLDGLEPRDCSYMNHCTPNIRPGGVVAGCDDHNRTRIEFCPMCGIELRGDGLEWADDDLP
jgi:hypothetical protein